MNFGGGWAGIYLGTLRMASLAIVAVPVGLILLEPDLGSAITLVWLLFVMFLVGGLCGMAMTDPAADLPRLVWFAVLVAFASATQDIVIDAFRIESGEPRVQAAMAASRSSAVSFNR